MKPRQPKDKSQKYWDKVMDELDEEHPPIEHNPWQFRYAGDKVFWFDLNDRHDPTEDWDNAIDGIQPQPPPPKDHEGRERLARKMLKHLDKKARKIVKEHLFNNKSFAQIGREMGYTRQNIKYHYDKAIETLQDKFNDKI